MTSPKEPPTPTGNPEVEPFRMTDPESGLPVPMADMRAEFERLSHQVPRDPEAECAFIESKIEMIRTDPKLSEADKKRAIEELQRGI